MRDIETKLQVVLEIFFQSKLQLSSLDLLLLTELIHPTFLKRVSKTN